MSTFINTVTEASRPKISKDEAKDAVIHIQMRLDYLGNIFYASGGANKYQHADRFNMYRSDIERKLDLINGYLNQTR